MAGRNIDGRVVWAGAGFAVGLVTGLFVNRAAKQAYEGARTGQWHREYGRTVTYDDNLPEPLARREVEGQPRFGGTGAIGVSPSAAGAVPSRADAKPSDR